MKKTILLITLLCGLHSVHAQEQSTPSLGRVGVGLEQLINSALIHNRTLQNAALEIESAKEQKSEAYTKYYPQISANVIAFQAFDKLIKGDGTYPQELAALEPLMPGISQMVGQRWEISELNRGFNVSISALQPIYAGGQIHTGNLLTQVQEDVCRLQLNLKEKEIREKVTENYWQICTIRYNLRTIAAAEKQLDAVMQQVKNYVDAGVTTQNALLQVKLRKHELASNRLKLENADKTLRLLLSQQTGIKNLDILVPDENYIPAPSLGEDLEGAVNRRTELALAGKAVEAQKLQIKMERGKNLPTIAVGLMGYHYNLGGFSNSLPLGEGVGRGTNVIALGTISIPISSWWGGKHAIRRQKLKLREAENDMLDARENLRIDIEAAWNNVQEAYSQIDIAKASVEESEENLRMHTEQYRTGIATITDLLDAETLNRKSHDQLSSSIATYHIALTKYQLKTE